MHNVKCAIHACSTSHSLEPNRKNLLCLLFDGLYVCLVQRIRYRLVDGEQCGLLYGCQDNNKKMTLFRCRTIFGYTKMYPLTAINLEKMLSLRMDVSSVNRQTFEMINHMHYLGCFKITRTRFIHKLHSLVIYLLEKSIVCVNESCEFESSITSNSCDFLIFCHF